MTINALQAAMFALAETPECYAENVDVDGEMKKRSVE